MSSQDKKIAQAFTRLLQEALSDRRFRDVRMANAFYARHICASHDHCDANAHMALAFREITGHEPDPDKPADAALWTAAWNTAKSDELTCPIAKRFAADGFELRDMGGGCLAYALPVSEHYHVLVTSWDGTDVLDTSDERALVGLHLNDGDAGECECEEVEGVEAAIAAAKDMAERYRHDQPDYGQDCVSSPAP